MDNVILEEMGDEVKIIRFGKIVCIRDRSDLEIDEDVLRWKDEDGNVILDRKSGFMTLTNKDGTTYDIKNDGELGIIMPG